METKPMLDTKQKRKRTVRRKTITGSIIERLKIGSATTHEVATLIGKSDTRASAFLSQLKSGGRVEIETEAVLGRRGKPAVWRIKNDARGESSDAGQGAGAAYVQPGAVGPSERHDRLVQGGAGLPELAGVPARALWKEAA